ncbi:helix-turn-helix domain-containing protein [Malikia granosa]|uniref:helix-turn-helix domain-containing protein n=1 Tax=Malikia granosa TaxID=263067 RepID=UPI003CCBD23E
MGHSLAVGSWTLSILRELIRPQFGHTMSLSSVSRVMSLLGITVQTPLYRHPRGPAQGLQVSPAGWSRYAE